MNGTGVGSQKLRVFGFVFFSWFFAIMFLPAYGFLPNQKRKQQTGTKKKSGNQNLVGSSGYIPAVISFITKSSHQCFMDRPGANDVKKLHRTLERFDPGETPHESHPEIRNMFKGRKHEDDSRLKIKNLQGSKNSMIEFQLCFFRICFRF